jgi:hypothetical protein
MESRTVGLSLRRRDGGPATYATATSNPATGAVTYSVGSEASAPLAPTISSSRSAAALGSVTRAS